MISDQPIHTCDDCGMLIGNAFIHARWHEQLNRDLGKPIPAALEIKRMAQNSTQDSTRVRND